MATDRWDFLAPWWRILQDHELLLINSRRGFREKLLGLSVGIYPRPPSPHPRKASAQMPQVRDALELALLLSIINRRAFEEFIHENTRAEARLTTAAVFEALPDASTAFAACRERRRCRRDSPDNASVCHWSLQVGLQAIDDDAGSCDAHQRATRSRGEHPIRQSRVDGRVVTSPSRTGACRSLPDRELSTSGYSGERVCEQTERDHFAQVCSALMHSRCVQSVTVCLRPWFTLDPVRRRFHLRFFMLMLFSRWATNGIQRVDFEGIQFSHDDVEDFNQLLLCENLLPAIFNNANFPTDGSAAAKQVLVTKNATVRLSLKKKNFFKISQATWFVVIKEARDWFVFVPAYGKCRIRRGDVIQERVRAASSYGSSQIKSVRFDAPSLRVGNSDGIFSILQRFGPRLEALAIRYASNEHAAALVALLASCLRGWNLQGSELEPPTPGDDPIPQHLTRVFATLADPTQRMAKAVRELIVSVRGPDGPLGDEGAAIRTMLEANTVLECFERKCSPVHNETLIRQCRKLNTTTIAATPVPPRCKVAFLGVVSIDSALQSTFMQLDSVMIRRIFDMAAERVVRQVFVGLQWYIANQVASNPRDLTSHRAYGIVPQRNTRKRLKLIQHRLIEKSSRDHGGRDLAAFLVLFDLLSFRKLYVSIGTDQQRLDALLARLPFQSSPYSQCPCGD